ncbi:MAG: hypothetical protein LUG50_07035, partial [Planctomycetaceae bacterium]|nr:hypothetical protein [Planctomycetaceae bacterium]
PSGIRASAAGRFVFREAPRNHSFWPKLYYDGDGNGVHSLAIIFFGYYFSSCFLFLLDRLSRSIKKGPTGISGWTFFAESYTSLPIYQNGQIKLNVAVWALVSLPNVPS